LAFSIVFFSKFILGVIGIEKLLMTGRLRMPVPASVIAGPNYRGVRFFMPILFVSLHSVFLGLPGFEPVGGFHPQVCAPCRAHI